MAANKPDARDGLWPRVIRDVRQGASVTSTGRTSGCYLLRAPSTPFWWCRLRCDDDSRAAHTFAMGTDSPEVTQDGAMRYSSSESVAKRKTRDVGCLGVGSCAELGPLRSG
jgi:hypothetical protein